VIDTRLNIVCVISGVVESDADEPRVKFRLAAQQTNSLFLGAVKFLQARDDFPDVWASGKCSTPIVRRTTEHDPGVVELIGALNNKLIKQRSGGHPLTGST
jgi:hypothetical protein